MGRVKTSLALIVAVLLILLFAEKMPQALFIPLAIVLWTFRAGITRALSRLPLPLAFIGCAWVLGMAIEVFAVWQNMPVPVGQRLLFDQDPAKDLVIGAVFYAVFAGAWYVILRRYAFNPWQVLGIQAVWSAVEQRGAVIVQATAAGPAGIFLLLFVAGVYGTWAFFPALFTHKRFAEKRPQRISPRWYHYLLALAVLYAIIGLIMLAG